MLQLLFSNPFAFIITALGLVISITIHEFAHAFMADRLGDPTPRLQDRLTLNPLAHLDPIGTAALLLVGLGWGKPVQFDPYNLKNPLRDSALIALAGPASNLVLATGLAVLLHAAGLSASFWGEIIGQIITINVVLAVFNLVPVHPLDGSKILLALLPKHLAIEFEDLMAKYSLFLLLALIFPWFNGTSPVSLLVFPVVNVILQVLGIRL